MIKFQRRLSPSWLFAVGLVRGTFFELVEPIVSFLRSKRPDIADTDEQTIQKNDRQLREGAIITAPSEQNVQPFSAF